MRQRIKQYKINNKDIKKKRKREVILKVEKNMEIKRRKMQDSKIK